MIQRYFINVSILINNEFLLEIIALFDTRADQNCIKERLIPTKYCEKTFEGLKTANGDKLKIKYKLTNAKICNIEIKFRIPFLIIKDITQNVILGLGFRSLIKP